MASPEAIYLTVSIDTEADHDQRWRRSAPLTFTSILSGLPDRLQPAFAQCGAIPTYLLAVEVLEDEACVRTLRELSGPHELGTHLHAAFVEPHKKFRDYAGVYSADFQASYPPAVEHAKLATLTDLFVRRLGYRPTSFRAGRFGAGAHTIDSLQSLGYKVDTSVTPHLQWFEPNGRVDFRHAPEQPYFPAAGSIDAIGSAAGGRLLEVPVSVRPRLLRRTPAWFRPWFSSVDAMKEIVRYQLRQHADSSAPLCLNMMFHSMEVIEEASPYPQTPDDVQRFLDEMCEALAWCAGEGARFVGLSDLYEIYGGEPSPSSALDSARAGR